MTCAECGTGPCRDPAYRTLNVAHPGYALATFIDQKAAWSRQVFGPDLPLSGILAHMRKEMREVEEKPEDGEEWVDIIFLALDGASRAGLSGEQITRIMAEKHVKNLRRKWLRKRSGHFEHDRKGEQP